MDSGFFVSGFLLMYLYPFFVSNAAMILGRVAKKIFTFSRPWLLRGWGSGDMSRPTKLFYGLKRGKKGPKMVLKSTKKVN